MLSRLVTQTFRFHKGIDTNKTMFVLLCLGICFLGLYVRLIQYDHVPGFNSTRDEFMYPWAGMSLLTTGTPTSWSGVGKYRDKRSEVFWGERYTLVTPWVHKPLLYPLITGGAMLLSGATEFDEVRLSTLRLVPIAIGFITTGLVIAAGSVVFDRRTGIIAGLLYATVPTIVITNRLSLIENALAPLFLLTLIALFARVPNRWEYLRPYALGLVSMAAILLKQIGVAIPAALFIYYVAKSRYKEASVIAVSSIIAVGIMFGVGWSYVGIDEYFALTKNLASYHSGGVPQLLSAIFRHPFLVDGQYTFPDAFILAGHILLLAAPWWIFNAHQASRKAAPQHIFLLLPYMYILALLMVESGSSRFYGWHLYPLFPFLVMAVAAMFARVYTDPKPLSLFGLFLLLSPAAGWFFKIFPTLHPQWHSLFLLAAAGVTLLIINPPRIRRLGLVAILYALLVLNVLVISNASLFIPSRIQPGSSMTDSN